MPDIFDQISTGTTATAPKPQAAPKGDIFDQIALESPSQPAQQSASPKRDIFDELDVAPAISQQAGQAVDSSGSTEFAPAIPAPQFDAQEAIRQAQQGIATGQFTGDASIPLPEIENPYTRPAPSLATPGSQALTSEHVGQILATGEQFARQRFPEYDVVDTVQKARLRDIALRMAGLPTSEEMQRQQAIQSVAAEAGPLQTAAMSAWASAGRGFASLDPLQYIPATRGISPGRIAREGFDFAQEVSANPDYYWTQVISGAFGSAVPFLMGGVAGLGARGMGVMGAMTGAAEGAEASERAGASGLSTAARTLGGAALGATEAIPINRVFGRLRGAIPAQTFNRIVGKYASQPFIQGLAGAAEEIGQEIVQTLGESALDSILFGDEFNPPLAEAAAGGGTVGFVLNTLASALSRGRTRTRQQAQPQPQQLPQLPPQRPEIPAQPVQQEVMQPEQAVPDEAVPAELPQEREALERLRQAQQQQTERTPDAQEAAPPQVTTEPVAEAPQVRRAEDAARGEGSVRGTGEGRAVDVPGRGGEAEVEQRQPWQMTRDEFEISQQGETYGDWYITPDGKFGQMRGSRGMGSNRVGMVDVNGEFMGWYNRDELRLSQKSLRETSGTRAADDWLADVSSRVAKLKSDNESLLLNKGITDRFRKAVQDGRMTQEQYNAALKRGAVLSDADYARAVEVEQQITEARETPLEVKENKQHRAIVEAAIREGKPVPAEVLADYPDLQATQPVTTPEAAPQAATPETTQAPQSQAGRPQPTKPQAPRPTPREGAAPATEQAAPRTGVESGEGSSADDTTHGEERSEDDPFVTRSLNDLASEAMEQGGTLRYAYRLNSEFGRRGDPVSVSFEDLKSQNDSPQWSQITVTNDRTGQSLRWTNVAFPLLQTLDPAPVPGQQSPPREQQAELSRTGDTQPTLTRKGNRVYVSNAPESMEAALRAAGAKKMKDGRWIAGSSKEAALRGIVSSSEQAAPSAEASQPQAVSARAPQSTARPQSASSQASRREASAPLTTAQGAPERAAESEVSRPSPESTAAAQAEQGGVAHRGEKAESPEAAAEKEAGREIDLTDAAEPFFAAQREIESKIMDIARRSKSRRGVLDMNEAVRFVSSSRSREAKNLIAQRKAIINAVIKLEDAAEAGGKVPSARVAELADLLQASRNIRITLPEPTTGRPGDSGVPGDVRVSGGNENALAARIERARQSSDKKTLRAIAQEQNVEVGPQDTAEVMAEKILGAVATHQVSEQRVSDKIIAKATKIEQDALQRMRERQLPGKGRHKGGSIIGPQLADLAIVVAARAVRGGVRGYKKIVQAVSSELGVKLTPKQMRTVVSRARRLVALSRDEHRAFDPERFDIAADELVLRSTPKAERTRQREPKAVTERQALRASMKAQVRASRQAYRAGLQTARSQVSVVRHNLRQSMKLEEQGRRQAALSARKAIVQMVRKNLPSRVHGRFLGELVKAKNIKDVVRSLAKLDREIAIAQAQPSVKSIRKLMTRKRMARLTNERRGELRKLFSEASPFVPLVTRKAKGTNPQISAASDRIIAIDRAMREIYAEHRAENAEIGRSIRQSRDAWVAQAVDNIDKSGKADIKTVGDKPRDVKLSIPRRFHRSFHDLQSIAFDVEGKKGGVIEQLAYKDMAANEEAYLSHLRDKTFSVDEAARKAGFASTAEAQKHLSERFGRGRTQTIDTTIGGKKVSLSMDEALDIALMDPTTEALVADGLPVQFGVGREQEPMKLTLDDVDRIRKQIPAKLMAFGRELKRVIEQDQPELFATLRRLKGWEPEKIADYWPRIRNSVYSRDRGLPGSAKEVIHRYIENIGMTIDRTTDRRTPLLIEGAISKTLRHIDNTAKIIHLSEGTRNAAMVVMDPRLKSAINRKWGSTTNEQLEKFVFAASRADIITPRTSAKIVRTLNSNLAKSVLALNPSTWSVQIGSVFRLIPTLGARGMREGVENATSFRMQELADRSGYFWERYRSNPSARFSPVVSESADSVSQGRFFSAVDATLSALRKGDLAGANRAWSEASDATMSVLNLADAVQAKLAAGAKYAESKRIHEGWTDRQHRDWAIRRAADIVREHNNSTSPLDMSAAAIDHRNDALGSLLLFTSDPIKSRNRILRALRRDPKEAAAQAASELANIAWAVTSRAAVGASLAWLTWAIFGGGDEDDWQKIKNAATSGEDRVMDIVSEALQVVDPVFLGRIVEAAQYFSGGRVEAPAQRTINEAISAASDAANAAKALSEGDSRKFTLRALRALDTFASNLVALAVGDPTYAVRRRVTRNALKFADDPQTLTYTARVERLRRDYHRLDRMRRNDALGDADADRYSSLRGWYLRRFQPLNEAVRSSRTKGDADRERTLRAKIDESAEGLAE